MAIENNGIHHLAIRVTDLARAKAFYSDLLGWPVMMEVPEENLAIINANGMIMGVRGDDDPTPKDDRFDPYRVGADHFAIGVAPDQMESIKAALDDAGVPNNGIEKNPRGGNPYISFYDPDGIAWELFSVPG